MIRERKQTELSRIYDIEIKYQVSSISELKCRNLSKSPCTEAYMPIGN